MNDHRTDAVIYCMKLIEKESTIKNWQDVEWNLANSIFRDLENDFASIITEAEDCLRATDSMPLSYS